MIEQVLQSLVVRLIGDATSFEKMMRTAETSTLNLVNQMTGAGFLLYQSLEASLVQVGEIAVREFKLFDDALNRSLGIMGVLSEASMREVRPRIMKGILDTARESIIPVKDLGAAYEILARNGISATHAVAHLNEMQQFAIATHSRLERVTKNVAAIQEGYGLASNDAAEDLANLRHILDNLTEAQRNSRVSAEELSVALQGRTALAARSVGMSFQETLSIISLWTRMRKEGQITGAFEVMLRNLTYAFTKHRDTWKSFGIEVFDDTTHAMRPMADIADSLTEKLGHMTPESRRLALNMLGLDLRSVTATASLIGMGKELRNIQAELQKSAGIMDTLAQHNMRSLSSAFANIQNRMKGIGYDIGRLLEPSIWKLVRALHALFDWWERLDEAEKKMISLMGLLTIKGTLILGVIGLAIRAIGLLIVPTYQLAVAMGVALYNGIRMVASAMLMLAVRSVVALFFTNLLFTLNGLVLVLTSLTVAFVGLGGVMASLSVLTSMDPEEIKEKVRIFILHVKGFFLNFEENMEKMGVWFVDQWKFMWEDVKELTRISLLWLAHRILDLITILPAFLGSGIATMIEMIGDAAKSIWDVMSDLFQSILVAGKVAFNPKNWMSNENIWEQIKSKIQNEVAVPRMQAIKAQQQKDLGKDLQYSLGKTFDFYGKRLTENPFANFHSAVQKGPEFNTLLTDRREFASAAGMVGQALMSPLMQSTAMVANKIEGAIRRGVYEGMEDSDLVNTLGYFKHQQDFRQINLKYFMLDGTAGLSRGHYDRIMSEHARAMRDHTKALRGETKSSFKSSHMPLIMGP